MVIQMGYFNGIIVYVVQLRCLLYEDRFGWLYGWEDNWMVI